MSGVFDEAVKFAAEAHAGQTRKGKSTPFLLHPMAAAFIVATLTDDEEVIAAAVLHDTVEDTDKTIEDVKNEFGDRIARLVAAESENKREEQPAESTWKIRKEETIEDLKSARRDVKMICLGDKLANLRELWADYTKIGEELWDRFNQKDPSMHAWYYRSIFDILAAEFGNDCAPIQEYRWLLDYLFGSKD